MFLNAFIEFLLFVKDPSTDLLILMNCLDQRIGGIVVHGFVKSLLGSKENIF
jgi:hypothetical protein